MKADANQYLLIYQATREYLRIATDYTGHFGKLAWSRQEDAVVSPEGKMFAFNAAIADFIDGFSSGQRVISFSFLLHAMELLQDRRRLSHPQAHRLHRAFNDEGMPWRSAGALFAVLTRAVPEVSPAPALQVVSARLRDVAYPVRWFVAQDAEFGVAVEPVLSPHQFEDIVFDEAEKYSNDELLAWFSTARGPAHGAGREAAREANFTPRTLSGVLAKLLQRPRLAGAETYVTRMIGALSLPPRRWTPNELPVGGYADMVTQGQIEQILPSQHALDDLEFLRRFAEHELLYFRREEPPAQNQQEWVVLLDQGIRAWGDVRLVLSAAALALGRMADKRSLGFHLAGTSNGGHVLDPLGANDAELGELIEASDLTLNPAEALEQVLQTPCEHLRDVVLLTHPRNVREADVLAAARRLGPRDRLFALALDAQGRAALCEVRHGAAIALTRFHVDFQPSVTPQAIDRISSSRDIAWSGDVEAIAFPFKIGSTGPIEHLDFDNHGATMLTVDKRGILQLWHLDDEVCETLPRVLFKGQVVMNYSAAMGVPGGFVLAACFGKASVLIRVDLTRRTLTAFLIPDSNRHGVTFYYAPGQNNIVIENENRVFMAFDLDTNQFQAHIDRNADVNGRPAIALQLANRNKLLRNQREITRIEAAAAPFRQLIHYKLELKTGELTLIGPHFLATPMTPLTDGKPILAGMFILHAQTARDHVLLDLGMAVESRRFLLLNGVTQSVVREYAQRWHKALILRAVLSPDGTRVALLLANCRVVVDTIASGSVFTTRVGGYSQNTVHYVGERGLAICSGAKHRIWHIFRWVYGVLTHTVSDHASQAQPHGCSAWHTLIDGSKLPKSELTIRVGQFGQLQIQNRRGETVASFFAFRGQVAAWMPDGTRYGAEALHLGPVTPDAAQRIGQALLKAEKEASVQA